MSSLIRWNPLREMAAMQNTLDRLFEQSFRPMFQEEWLNVFSLPLDVYESTDAYYISTELPGVAPENINTRLDGDMLIIEGEIREQAVEKESARALIKERRYGKFTRSIRLPNEIDVEYVDATFENGVLKLSLPKRPEIQPKQIPVKTSAK